MDQFIISNIVRFILVEMFALYLLINYTENLLYVDLLFYVQLYGDVEVLLAKLKVGRKF